MTTDNHLNINTEVRQHIRQQVENPVIYNHRSPVSINTEVRQHIKEKNHLFVINSNPYKEQTITFIATYQTTYSHQHKLIGFLAVGQTEFVARASELITGFGTGNGMYQMMLIISLANGRQAASSVIGINGGYSLDTSALGAGASAKMPD